MNVSEAISYAQTHLADGESPKVDAERILQFVLDKPRSFLFTWPEHALTLTQETNFKDYIARRVEGVPVAYIVGTADFWTLTLAVSKHTLIPRPDTEVLVEQVLARHGQNHQLNLLDLGTGTGAIALALATEQPSWTVLGVDKVTEAVNLATQNGKTNGVGNARFIVSSWFDNVPVASDEEPLGFDLIVSNPPYIDHQDHHLDQGDVRFEPASALVADEHGLADIRKISEDARAFLTNKGWLYFEHGYNQGAAVRDLMSSYGYQQVETFCDYGGNERVTCGQWLNASALAQGELNKAQPSCKLGQANQQEESAE